MKVDKNWSGVVLVPENDDEIALLQTLAMALERGGVQVGGDNVWLESYTGKLVFSIQ